MNDYNVLVGKSVKDIITDRRDNSFSIIFKDGTILEANVGYPDCCGYNEVDYFVDNGFDFNDNVVTKVEYSESEGYDADGYVQLGIFSNDLKINIEGNYGSGSGWNYGQYVELTIMVKDNE